jgi:hypothetical protein
MMRLKTLSRLLCWDINELQLVKSMMRLETPIRLVEVFIHKHPPPI